MNPYQIKKESAVYLGETYYQTKDKWEDTELDLYVEGPHLILGSITFSTYVGANVGFRLTNTIPLRPKTNLRIPVQFSVEPQLSPWSKENLSTFSFHVVAHCYGAVKLQVLTGDGNGFIYMNMLHGSIKNKPYDHRTICTLSAIPLGGIEEQKNNVVRQPTRRSAPASIEEESVKTIPKNPDKPISNSKNFKISSSSSPPSR